MRGIGHGGVEFVRRVVVVRMARITEGAVMRVLELVVVAVRLYQ